MTKDRKIHKIKFSNAQGESISGILRENDAAKPLFIICHGYGGSMDEPVIKKVSELLYKHGHTTFIFNFSESAQKEALQEQVSDIETISKYFKEYKKIILLGISFGALSTSIATKKSNKVKGLITVNGFFGTPHLNRSGLKTYLLFRFASLISSKHKKIWRYMRDNYQPASIKVPVLVIHSQTDKDVSIKQSQSFYQLIKNKKEFHTLKNADHSLTMNGNSEEVVEAINKWLKRIY